VSAGWTDGEGNPVTAPEPPPTGSYYGPIGDFQGAEYDRNAFALGTAQEVAHLREALDLQAGEVVVDVGCGTGRHARALAALGVRAVGVDLSAGLLRAAAAHGPTPVGGSAGGRAPVGGPAGGRAPVGQADAGVSGAHTAARALFVQADARALPLPDGAADAVLCLCQGGFGITPGGDREVLGELVRVLRPGGRLALTAFSLAFAVRTLAPDDAIDLGRGLVHSPAEVRGPDGARRTFDLWTSCYTPAHLVALCEAAGLAVDRVSGVEPGRYGDDEITLRHPELLIVAHRA
jgi:SAM-dependent methyltransferase